MVRHHRLYRAILLVLLALIVLTVKVSAEEALSPEVIVHKSIEMLNDDCDFACCHEIAGLYTKRYLDMTRQAILASLKANANAESVIKQGFGGKATNLAEVAAFTPRELFAWHICDTIMQIPAKYRYSKLEIIDTRHISPDRIEYVVRLSGLAIAPDTKEEAFYRVVRENNQWRIDQ